jgi:hypothetical protein
MMVYKWGSRTFPVPAQEVGEIVEQLYEANGPTLPPDALWQAAADAPESALYKLFTWDKDAAAIKCWRQESRVIINQLVVVNEQTGEQTPAFYHVRLIEADGVSEGYAPSYVVLEDDNMRGQALAEAMQSLRGFRRRYQHLRQLSAVFDAIDQLVLEPVEV